MKNLIDVIDWEKGGGLVPAIIQDSQTMRVLMLGYMNREALTQTIESGRVSFFARSKKRIWTKGETSGNFLLLDDIRLDCDQDALLVHARPLGPTCHNGTETCWGAPSPDAGFLGQLESIIDQRIATGAEGSYIASLHSKGIARIAQKVGEEGVEVALAAVVSDDDAVTGEAGDLVLHLLLLLRARGLSLKDVGAALEKRHEERRKKRLA